MGKRGPAPKPTAILKLHGSRLAKEREKRQEPKPPAMRPDAPAFLNGDDQRIWENVLAKIEKTPELLTIVDGMQLERYTKYLARWREIERELEKFRGTIVAALVKKETRQVMRLLWQESRLMDTALKQIEDGFGLSPKARVGLTVKPGEEHRNPLSASARKRG